MRLLAGCLVGIEILVQMHAHTSHPFDSLLKKRRESPQMWSSLCVHRAHTVRAHGKTETEKRNEFFVFIFCNRSFILGYFSFSFGSVRCVLLLFEMVKCMYAHRAVPLKLEGLSSSFSAPSFELMQKHRTKKKEEEHDAREKERTNRITNELNTNLYLQRPTLL